MVDVDLGTPPEPETDWQYVDSIDSDPYTAPPDFAQSAGYNQDSDSDEDYRSEALENSRIGPKPGGYGGRIEQILYENPNLPILITEAGKGSDGSKYIVYTIRTGVSCHIIIQEDLDSYPHRTWKFADVTLSSLPSETH